MQILFFILILSGSVISVLILFKLVLFIANTIVSRNPRRRSKDSSNSYYDRDYDRGYDSNFGDDFGGGESGGSGDGGDF